MGSSGWCSPCRVHGRRRVWSPPDEHSRRAPRPHQGQPGGPARRSCPSDAGSSRQREDRYRRPAKTESAMPTPTTANTTRALSAAAIPPDSPVHNDRPTSVNRGVTPRVPRRAKAPVEMIAKDAAIETFRVARSGRGVDHPIGIRPTTRNGSFPKSLSTPPRQSRSTCRTGPPGASTGRDRSLPTWPEAHPRRSHSQRRHQRQPLWTNRPVLTSLRHGPNPSTRG